MKKVLLGMSGGVDSSVAAILLLEKKFDVTGVTFLFSDRHEHNMQNLDEASKLADKLGIRHITVNLADEFRKEIVAPFVRSYSMGETPFPCAVCNPELKFKHLELLADKYSCDRIATGHYVNLEEYNNCIYISKGSDNEKDQSFFLWGLKQNLLQRTLFPLGGLHKSQVREVAGKYGFQKMSVKKDSLGICFFDGTNYRDFLLQNGIDAKPGNIKDAEGNILGVHQGIVNYTIGQRRGLGININRPIFVTDILPETNELIVGDYQLLYRNKIYIRNYYFTDIHQITKERQLVVRIRYRLQETPCTIRLISDSAAEINLLEPVAMVANGQTAVFYDGNRVTGGGFIIGST